MADKIHGFMPASAEMPTDRQRLFLRYFTGVLIDLVVLNLFDEYSDKVTVAIVQHLAVGGGAVAGCC